MFIITFIKEQIQLYLNWIKDNKCYDIDFFVYKYFQSSLDFFD